MGKLVQVLEACSQSADAIQKHWSRSNNGWRANYKERA